MSLSVKTGIYFGLKDKIIKYLPVLFLLSLSIWNCAGSTFQKMANENPASLLAKKDSLQRAGSFPPALKKAFVTAHNSVGQTDLESKDYTSALQHFKAAAQLAPDDTLTNYNLLLTKGHLLVKAGKRDGLWDAIQNYHSGARLFPKLGDPYYYIGNAYLKIGNTDFDLILESYDKALTLTLSTAIQDDVTAAREKAIQREKTLKGFWK